jgi:GxxExxY protein
VESIGGMMARRGAVDAEMNLLNQIKKHFMEINEITGIIIEESIKIHRDVGPGLLEKVYEELLFYRLTKRGLKVKRQQKIEFVYEEIKMDIDLRYDLMVEESVLVEIKSKETVPAVDYKVFKTYLRLTNITIGLVINFNMEYLRDGIKRIANNFIDK